MLKHEFEAEVDGVALGARGAKGGAVIISRGATKKNGIRHGVWTLYPEPWDKIGPTIAAKKIIPMKISAAITLGILLTLPVAAAERADLTLRDGRVLKAARVVALGEKTASIVHAGGLESVPIDNVPLDVLARAHIEIEDKTKADATKNAELKARVDARTKAAEEKKAEEIQLRLAAANVRAANQGDDTVTMPKLKLEAEAGSKLSALKAKFPPKRSQIVTVGITGRKNRIDRIEVEVPTVDMWSYYRGMIQTTTVEALPITLKRIDDRANSDHVELSKRLSGRDEAAVVQARACREWLERDLKPYLAQFRTLVDSR